MNKTCCTVFVDQLEGLPPGVISVVTADWKRIYRATWRKGEPTSSYAIEVSHGDNYWSMLTRAADEDAAYATLMRLATNYALEMEPECFG
jgi:hypothetical protein